MYRLAVLLFLFFAQIGYGQDSLLAPISTLQFPFKINIKTIEAITNQSMQGILYRDSLYTDQDNDQFKCTVWKAQNIRILPVKNNVLRIDVPLKVWAEKGVGKLGVYTYQHTEFKLTMSFLMAYNISKDWRLLTKTFKNGYTWQQKPSLDFGWIKIPITPIVEKILDEQQTEFTTKIDSQIAQNISLKKDMIALWNRLRTPTLVSDTYNTWFCMQPTVIEATPFVQDAQYIRSNYRINLVAKSYVGTDTPLRTSAVVDIPNLRYVANIGDSFQIHTVVAIPYEQMSLIAATKFKGKEYSFSDGKYQVSINDIRLFNSNNKLGIETDMQGSFNGKLLIEGNPVYDESRQVIRFDNLEYALQTKNIFHNVAKWLFNGKIERNLQENFEMPLKELLDYGSQSTSASLNQCYNGCKTKGFLTEFKPTKFYTTPQYLQLILTAKGKLEVEM